MSEKGRYTRCLSICLGLAFLSWPSLLPAFNVDFDKAKPIVVGALPENGVIPYDGQTQYRWFTLSSAGTISVHFTHTPDRAISDNAWRIQVLDEGSSSPYFDTKSKLNDKGALCSGNLPNGRHYLLVQGLNSSNGTPISLNVPYKLSVTTQRLNVKLLDDNLLDDDGKMDPTYLTLQEAFNNVPSDCSNCRIRSRSFTYNENLLYDKAVVVAIEGGKNNCFDEDEGFTTVRGSLKVARGTVTVKRLKVY